MFILKMCVYTGSISAMKHTTHVTLAPHPSTPPGIQSAENTGDDHNSVPESYPGSCMLLIQILEQQQTMLTSSPSRCSKSSNAPPHEDNLNSKEFTNRTWKFCWGLYILREPGESRNLLLQFQLICTTNMKFYIAHLKLLLIVNLQFLY